MGLFSRLFGHRPLPGLGIPIEYKVWTYGPEYFTHEVWQGVLVALVPGVPTKDQLPPSTLFAVQALVLDSRGFFVQLPLDHLRAQDGTGFWPNVECNPDPARRQKPAASGSTLPEVAAAAPAAAEPPVPAPVDAAAQRALYPTTRYRWLFDAQGELVGSVTIPPGYADATISANPQLQCGPLTSIQLEVVDGPVPACPGGGREGLGHVWNSSGNYVACLCCKLRRDATYTPDGKRLLPLYYHSESPGDRTYYTQPAVPVGEHA